MTESDFQQQVLQYAHLRGWACAHFRPARTANGWRTPVQADAQGFPDLVLCRRGRLLFVELKRNGGTLSDPQIEWLARLSETPAEVYVWTPADWNRVEELLR